jgi:hypothetical protein
MQSAAFSTVLTALLLVQGMLIFFLAWRAGSDRQRVSPSINRHALAGLMGLGAANVLLFAAMLASRLGNAVA